MKRGALIFLLAIVQFSGIAWGFELPSSFDLRNINGRSYIGPIRDQGQCGSCWAFGTLASAESVWNRTYDKYDEQAVDFSEAFLVWSMSPLYEDLEGCYGGGMDLPQNDALIKYGVPLEEAFPYTIDDPGDDLRWDAPRTTFLDWYRIPAGDIETMRRVLYEVGAVTTGVLVEDDFAAYQEGIFENQRTTINHALPYYSDANHLISLVGWEDEPGDGGLGYWILRNSWDSEWGEDGNIRIRYTSARVALFGSYMTLQEWTGESVELENDGEISAIPWSAGGTLNAHGVDLWSGAASSVTNRGQIMAQALSDTELATARGVYIWGGPEGQVVNEGEIVGLAVSGNQQAYAYGICLQGGQVDNRGQVVALAVSETEQAMALGIWAANGGHSLDIVNDGVILSAAMGDDINVAYGIWADSRAMSRVNNSGRIGAFADDYAIGVLLSGGPAVLVNSGLIEAAPSLFETDLVSGLSVGVRAASQGTIIRNSGTIKGTAYSIYSSKDTSLILETGSDLIGPAAFEGENDVVGLLGTGSEEINFYGVETLVMGGDDWTLSGDSSFDFIQVVHGRLGVDGALAGATSVLNDGILGGNGSLTGNVTTSGTVAPGTSVGHLTIDGDLTQTANATLEIEIGDGVADRLTVSGTATLAGTLLLLPDGYATGGSYTFLDAGTIAGGFDTLASAAVLSFSLSSAADSLSVDVTRNSYLSLANGHNRGLASNLDGVRATAGDDFGTLLDRLVLSLTQPLLNTAMASLTPRIHGLTSTVLLGDSQTRLADLRRHLQQHDPAALLAQKPEGATTAWVDLLGHYNSYRSDGAYYGARTNLHGLMLGVERTARSGLTLGLAAAVTESRLKARDSGDDGEIDSQQGYLYAAWRNPRSSTGVHLNTAVGIGRTRLSADRHIPFAGRRAESKHDGILYSATISGGYAMNLGGWTLDPTAGLSFVHLREESFREKGADSANLSLATRENDSFQSLMGLRLSRDVSVRGFTLTPDLFMEWRHEFDRRTEGLSASLAGGGDRFDTPGRDMAGDALLLGTSVRARISDNFYGSLSYDCTLQSNTATGHALGLKIALIF